MKPFRALMPFVAVCAVLVAVSCMPERSENPSGSGATVKKTIGSAGGELTLEDFTLTIPAGALAEDVDISVTSNAAPMGATYAAWSPVFELAPATLTFATPVTVTLTPSVAGNRPSMSIFLTAMNQTVTFEELASTTSGDETSAQVMHLGSVVLAERGTGNLDAGDGDMPSGTATGNGGGVGTGGGSTGPGGGVQEGGGPGTGGGDTGFGGGVGGGFTTGGGTGDPGFGGGVGGGFSNTGGGDSSFGGGVGGGFSNTGGGN